MILLDKERISAQILANMFEVSTRTIYRDIENICMAGIPIRSTAGVGGGFEIMPQYKIDKNVLSTTDLSTILMSLSNLSNMMQNNDFINALAKIKSLIPVEKENDIEIKANQIYIDPSPWIGNRNIYENLEIIKLAMQEKKLLSFEYTDCHGNKTKRTIEPYQLVLKSSHWYCQVFCLKRNDFRLFKLSRISSLQSTGDFYVPRDYQKPLLDFTDILETLQTRIKIRIHKSIMDRVLDYCDYEYFSPEENEHYIVSFPFIENEYYYNILFSFGNKCECLEPKHIRKEIKRRIHEVATLYGN